MNKINNRFYTTVFLVLLFSCIHSGGYSQHHISGSQKLKVISTATAYRQSIQQHPGLELIDVKQVVPGIRLALRYATKNNFIRKQIYKGAHTTYLRKIAATALAAVQKELNSEGLGLKIFDAYRPYSATKLMWELIKDERYTADPAKGSAHNRGIAVDLTIIRLSTGQALDMGTDFDHFTDSAHHGFANFSTEILQNRKLLKRSMEKQGFKALETEWWHYAFNNGIVYDLLDLRFKQLQRL